MENSNLSQEDEPIKDYNYVILKKQFDNFGSEEIINEFGQVIGEIKTLFFNQLINLKIQDFFCHKSIVIERVKNPFYSIICLKDKDNNLIGKIKKKKSLFPASKIYIEDNNKHYTALGNFKCWNYELINNLDEKLIARVKNMNKNDTLNQKLHLNSSKYYNIKFINQNIEKITIISYVISINNLINKLHGVSDIMGIERMIARLRPFGPGKSLN